MFVSVIIPTFNRKNFVPKAIESVLKQSYKKYEIIIVDDGSGDGTQDYVRSNFPMVRLIFQSNRGVSAARNTGILHSKGDWIAFLDSDDQWLPKKLEYQINTLSERKDYLVCHTNEIWIRNGLRINQKQKHQKYGGFIFEKSLDMCRISPSSILINRKVFNDVGNFDENLRICEDYDLWLRIAAKYPIYFLEKALILKYGGHDGQLSKNLHGIEQYRIQSLEKILGSTDLNDGYYRAAVKMLLKKILIFKSGLAKRNKKVEYLTFQKKFDYWSQQGDQT